MRKVSVIGVGSSNFGRHPDVSIQDLAIGAAEDAIQESGIERKEVGALYLGNFVSGMLTGQEILAGLVADGLGLGNIPCTKVEGACASGGIAVRHAYLSVAMGLTDVAIACGTEKETHVSNPELTAALNSAMDNAGDGTSGLTFPGLFGMIYRLHQQRHGTTRRQLSSIVVKNKANGLTNPLAQMGKDVTPEQVEQSEPIADPLLLYDCCPASDGAAAVVVAAADRAKEAPKLPIEILAAAQTRGAPRIAGHADICSFQATVDAAAEAYAQAGIGPGDLDFVELHDCFSMAEIIDAEDLGLMPRGQGGPWAEEGRTAIDGEIPINTSGGLIAKGHPVGATGVGQAYEAVLQLRGEHPNQVKDAGIGLTHNLGGTGVACSVSIFKRPDA